MKFKLAAPFKPAGGQPDAVEKLVKGISSGMRFQTLLGVTGSGKTYTLANVIEKIQKPVLVMSHNKTLAAQLYSEFSSFFPENAVRYFVSFYDYYQPEAYLPGTDTYIEKDADLNEEIDRLRLLATESLMERDDVIIVASVSCIYSLGSPFDYRQLHIKLKKGMFISRDTIARRLVDIQYQRNEIDFRRGKFRMRGDTIEIFPAYTEEPLRVELFGDEIKRISVIHPVSAEILEEREEASVYPAKHFVTTRPQLQSALGNIRNELKERLGELRSENRLVEAQRLEQRANYDLEMLEEIGHCSGIENYSAHLSGRKPGERPFCLIDYYCKEGLPAQFLTIIDESHVSIPQIGGMYEGDRSRKETLVEYGFRLPSCLDNRPLKWKEFEDLIGQTVFVSATPGQYELKNSKQVVELVIRPTFLVDPPVSVRPVKNQVDDLIAEIRKRVEKKQRVLVTTLTKKMAEDLTDYLRDLDIKVKYLHSEVETLDRIEILRDLRLGKFDCLIGINLLREGLDLPEVACVAILDADKEGFLHSINSLIQISGRTARNIDGEVIMYADRMTSGIRGAVSEMERRRKVQLEYNREHGTTPRSIYKTQEEILEATKIASFVREKDAVELGLGGKTGLIKKGEILRFLYKEMGRHAAKLEFEKAAKVRDEIRKISGDTPNPVYFKLKK